MIIRVFWLLTVISAMSQPFPKEALEQRLCVSL